jgi:hypothetical protein
MRGALLGCDLRNRNADGQLRVGVGFRAERAGKSANQERQSGDTEDNQVSTIHDGFFSSQNTQPL